MSLDFESETRESDGAIVTTYYGPKHIRGPSETRVIHHGAAFDPQVGVGQIMAKLGAINRESTQERVERWHFDAMSKPGRAGDNLFRRIDWTIREARHASDPNHNPEWKLGVVLTHDGNDFMVHPDIDISFKNAHGIFHLRPKTTRTPTKVEPPQKKLEYWHNLLDKTAASLPLDLLKDNFKSVATAKQG
ncbi:hypothetical protein BFJ66_g17350 [Fusarium oxysporum f. sp. cepae]|uniref:Uncharacterized protein n=1 Tax=Fusarium oxysporum f. sp. cepae TaxID=396571 RepID=A0A3L6MU61_FUSOX|nr:hypothetical protein BFJ65_g17090 [Fusarium oxysporum f. sp. cepae]RKK21586.1 hypothetical protein BFJ67_g17189 [Fusarium oxysporum f. sp. cepae]RKK23831.1 hypothetical protein BFJ66_g17350 [Fusarium oxysporum f. sp. cepae]